jgi:hypothetical protein
LTKIGRGALQNHIKGKVVGRKECRASAAARCALHELAAGAAAGHIHRELARAGKVH